MKKFLICLLCNLFILSETAFARPIPDENFLKLEKNPCHLEIDSAETLETYISLNSLGYRDVQMKERYVIYKNKIIKCDTFVHAGMLYVPVRQLLGFLNKTILYSDVDKTVIIIESNVNTENEDLALMNSDLKMIEKKTARVSDFTILYNNQKIEGQGVNIGVGKIGALFNCDGRLFMPLKAISSNESLDRIYKDDKIYLIENLSFEEKSWDSKGINGLYEEEGRDENAELNMAMLKAVNSFSEPNTINEVSATKILFYNKPAIWVKVEGNLSYQTSLYPGQKMAKNFIYTIKK